MDLSVFIRLALLTAVLAVSSPDTEPPTPTAVPPSPTIVATAPVAPATPTILPRGTTYTVKAGDTLAAIAVSYGVTVDELAQLNNIKDVNSLAIGQVLYISGKANVQTDGIALVPSSVHQGDTLEFKITAPDVVTATGTFAGANAKFVLQNGVRFALTGISRCVNVGTYPAKFTLIFSDGRTEARSLSVRVSATNYPVQNITLTPQMAALLDPAIERAENARLANLVAPVASTPMWQGAFRSPLKIADPLISAVFGQKRSYNGGPVGACGHEGEDFAVDGGTPVYAPASGIVALAEPLKVRGNVVLLNHGLGVFSGFYHLSQINVKAGQRVNVGDLVGKVGTTGFSTGDHLHWSMWVNGVYVDPIAWTTRTIP